VGQAEDESVPAVYCWHYRETMLSRPGPSTWGSRPPLVVVVSQFPKLVTLEVCLLLTSNITQGLLNVLDYLRGENL
jgi:hypothetical protein